MLEKGSENSIYKGPGVGNTLGHLQDVKKALVLSWKNF